MSARRGVALVMMVVALATVSTSAAAATATTGSAKPTICVALVVDGRALGSDVSTSCATVPKGATGIDVLQAGGHTVGFRSDGLLCTIDGLPKSGCRGVDDTHYWAYFHRAPGKTSWAYSAEGASSYQPVNDATEGWVYDDGKALTPENVPYAQICKTEPKPSPTPSHSLNPPPSQAPTSAPATKPAAPRPTATATSVKRHHHRASGLRVSSPSTTISLAPTPTVSSTSAALVGAVKPASNRHGWLDLLIGLIIVAALGVSAIARFRRSARSP
jgi:hypothetical protein